MQRAPPLARGEPGLHVTIIAALGIGDGEQEAFGAVEETGVQDVVAQEQIKPVANAGQE